MSEVREGILASAQALGVEPLDLATAMSYETAGTFNPVQPGPTTQHGQHKGFIQWGEPQARQYGVDWGNPVGSQLGEDGAVVRYLRDRGVQPGMGLLDIYSAINAGRVGLYDRTDENNGGAPGTVRDKVQTQMAGHKDNASKLLGAVFSGEAMGPPYTRPQARPDASEPLLPGPPPPPSPPVAPAPALAQAFGTPNRNVRPQARPAQSNFDEMIAANNAAAQSETALKRAGFLPARK